MSISKQSSEHKEKGNTYRQKKENEEQGDRNYKDIHNRYKQYIEVKEMVR